jgi:hypothetical protein
MYNVKMAAVLISEHATLLATTAIKCDVEKNIPKIFKFPKGGLYHIFSCRRQCSNTLNTLFWDVTLITCFGLHNLVFKR